MRKVSLFAFYRCTVPPLKQQATNNNYETGKNTNYTPSGIEYVKKWVGGGGKDMHSAGPGPCPGPCSLVFCCSPRKTRERRWSVTIAVGQARAKSFSFTHPPTHPPTIIFSTRKQASRQQTSRCAFCASNLLHTFSPFQFFDRTTSSD